MWAVVGLWYATCQSRGGFKGRPVAREQSGPSIELISVPDPEWPYGPVSKPIQYNHNFVHLRIEKGYVLF